MKTILLILISFSLFGQSPQSPAPSSAPRPARQWLSDHNDAVHFYSSCFANDIYYSTQGLIWKDWTPTKKLLFSNAMTLATISGKEFYDTKKANPTGWSWDDWLTGLWAMAIYTIVRICLNDFREIGLLPRKRKDKYYIGKDL